jgi:hypothetical protein
MIAVIFFSSKIGAKYRHIRRRFSAGAMADAQFCNRLRRAKLAEESPNTPLFFKRENGSG